MVLKAMEVQEWDEQKCRAQSMKYYNVPQSFSWKNEVPKEERERLIAEAMAMDYRGKGNHVFEEFCGFVGEKVLGGLQK